MSFYLGTWANVVIAVFTALTAIAARGAVSIANPSAKVSVEVLNYSDALQPVGHNDAIGVQNVKEVLGCLKDLAVIDTATSGGCAAPVLRIRDFTVSKDGQPGLTLVVAIG